jgi:hypothetical protein
LTVVVLLSLQRIYSKRVQNCFAENAIVDEHAEAVKVATAAKKSILVLYVLEVTQCSPALTRSIIKQNPKQRAKGFYKSSSEPTLK